MASTKQNKMLAEGAVAPDFVLHDLGGTRRSKSQIANGQPLLLAFFKISCPTCQFTMPYLQRLAGGSVPIYAISQDDAESTREFHQEFGISLPTLLDTEEEGYPASNAYGLSHVPSLFLVEPDGKISQSFMGFDKRELQRLGDRVGKQPFEAGEYVPESKSG
jgi:peroxiredoxin